jgi:hypothetical protein
MCLVGLIQKRMRGWVLVPTLWVVRGIGALGWSGCGPDVHSVSITLEEFRVTPHRTVLFGQKPLRLVISNRGREPHLFESSLLTDPTSHVVWEEGERSTPFLGQPLRLNPKDTAILMIEAPLGFYWFRCPLRGNKAMKGSMEIVG